MSLPFAIAMGWLLRATLGGYGRAHDWTLVALWAAAIVGMLI